MYKEPYEERTKRLSVALPRTLYRDIIRKLPLTNYGNVSELVRDLLRKWAKTEIIEAKTVG